MLKKLTLKKCYAFAAHFSEFAIVSYIIGLAIGGLGYSNTIAIILTFLLGWGISAVIGALLFNFFTCTPLEWLWGCKLKIENLQKSKFASYLMWRLAIKKLDLDEYKGSMIKKILGAVILLIAIAVYFL